MNKTSLNFIFLLILISMTVLTLIFKCSPISVHAQYSENITSLNYNASYPSIGASKMAEFYWAYPNVINNMTITRFISTYGIKSWNSELAYIGDDRYEYVYVEPENNYSKRIVFLYYRPDKTGLNNSVIWAKEIDKDEKLSPMNAMPGFTTSIAIFSIGLMLLITNSKRKLR